MEPAHQHQQMWGPQPPPHQPAVVSDREYWDTTAELLALIGDPVGIDEEPESEDSGTTTSDFNTSGESLDGDARLTSRVRSESGGFLVALTCLDRDSWVLDEPETHQEAIVRNDLSCWIQFEDTANSSDCTCAFADFVQVFGANVSFWVIEIVQLAVRVENLTIGPAS